MARNIDILRMTARDLEVRLRDAGLGVFFRPGQVEAAGISRHQLRTLVRRGLLEHVSRGLYRQAHAELTENYSLAVACARVPSSVVCLLSALRVHGIGTQSPSEVWLAIPFPARTPRLSGVRLRVVRFTGEALTVGVANTRFEEVPARITTPARTIVDCFRFQRLVGPETPMEALEDALRQGKVSVSELSQLEETFRSRRLSGALDRWSI